MSNKDTDNPEEVVTSATEQNDDREEQATNTNVDGQENFENEAQDEAETIAEQEPTLEDQIEDLQGQLQTAQDDVLRAKAEAQNSLMRAEKQVQNAHKFALDKIAADLTNVVDNLERALQSFDSDTAGDSASLNPAIKEGVELTLKSFIDILQKYQITTVEPHGEPFDPELHQAVSMVPSADVEPNTVIEVLQKGYRLHERLIRPAMVVVSKAE